VPISSTFYVRIFLYASALQSFSLVHFCFVFFGKRILAKKARVKCWWNWPLGVIFTNILRAAFSQISFFLNYKHKQQLLSYKKLNLSYYWPNLDFNTLKGLQNLKLQDVEKCQIVFCAAFIYLMFGFEIFGHKNRPSGEANNIKSPGDNADPYIINREKGIRP